MNGDSKLLIGIIVTLAFVAVVASRGIDAGHKERMERIERGYVPTLIVGTTAIHWAPNNCVE